MLHENTEIPLTLIPWTLGFTWSFCLFVFCLQIFDVINVGGRTFTMGPHLFMSSFVRLPPRRGKVPSKVPKTVWDSRKRRVLP